MQQLESAQDAIVGTLLKAIGSLEHEFSLMKEAVDSMEGDGRMLSFAEQSAFSLIDNSFGY